MEESCELLEVILGKGLLVAVLELEVRHSLELLLLDGAHQARCLFFESDLRP